MLFFSECHPVNAAESIRERISFRTLEHPAEQPSGTAKRHAIALPNFPKLYPSENADSFNSILPV